MPKESISIRVFAHLIIQPFQLLYFQWLIDSIWIIFERNKQIQKKTKKSEKNEKSRKNNEKKSEKLRQKDRRITKKKTTRVRKYCNISNHLQDINFNAPQSLLMGPTVKTYTIFWSNGAKLCLCTNGAVTVWVRANNDGYC